MQWTDVSVRLMHDFAEYTDFYKKLAAFLAPHLDRNGHICDAGCGIGYLGREIASSCRLVTGVEMNPLAAKAAQQYHADIANYTVKSGDIYLLPPSEPYDDMVCCFFGSVLESLMIAKRQCKGRLIMVKRDMDHHRFSTKYVKLWKQPLIEATYALEEWGIPFEKYDLTLEAGQPFRNLSDGVDFFTLYSQEFRAAKITEQEVYTRLSKGREPYPYYLPMERKMGILIVNTKDIDGGKLCKKLSHLL